MKRYNTGEWIRMIDRRPSKAELKKYIILYYYEPVKRYNCTINEVVRNDPFYGNRLQTHWMKINRPTIPEDEK